MNKANECTCPSGDGSLVHPCPAHPAVEQVGGDERAVDGKPRATKCPDCGEGDLMPGDLCACGYETDPSAGYACSECDGSGDGYVGEVCRECDGSGWFVTPEQARAALAQPSPDAPYADGIAADLERSDWTPEDALRWYAAGKHFDTVNGRTRIIDTGAVASNALKHLSLPYLEMKGDAELTELHEAMAQPSPAPELELLRSALSHIIKTCGQSRTETRRLRWIAQRAQWALDGKPYDISAFDLPKYSATAKERLEREVKVLREYARGLPAPVAQAQHSVPDVLFDGAAVYADLDDRQRMFTSPENVSVVLDAVVRVVRAAAPTPSNSVPQAWLDVQAERRRQIEAEGWTPEHDDEHSHGQMARAAACYALAGSSAPNDGTAALLVSLAWPWDEQWWKPSTARRDMVKACALALAEIERLDRAGAPGKEVGHE
ncbi:hypothetical protein RMF19_26305 [Pseudomonas aeruginosa]|uniref:hypothetical protein n=1 Tax=Pseudomonas aeruginosa TaxID=287 RepID=UPI00287EFE5C|nr:hypothetical protein [Pseudomonas aeruginosa]MDS9763906.1 hypothetical protein [Pseudomonas aeruginosa]MDT8545140.1 hypothetical protein [Pseudomonas aeruginosa]